VVSGAAPAARYSGRAYAARHRLPHLSVGRGLLRGGAVSDADPQAWSFVLDDIGFHADATGPSRLERLLNGDPLQPLVTDTPDTWPVLDLERPEVQDRARACITALLRARGVDPGPASGSRPSTGPCRRVLVVDQPADETAPGAAASTRELHHAMLSAARRENPEAEILIAPAGARSGHFGAAELDRHTRPAIGPDADPLALAEQADRVYVVSALLGFEALLLGRPVTCFGTPFYAGWGLTDDRGTVPTRRARRRSLEQVFAAAYLGYARYVDPDLNEPCSLERVIEHLALQRDYHRRNDRQFLGYGITWWKRNYVRRFLASPGRDTAFYQRVAAIPDGLDPGRTAVVVWGQRDTAALRAKAAANGYPVWRLEDGFLRSVGLGTDLTAPASLVLDSRGIYYDPSRPSDLEQLLLTTQFEPALLQRARALRRQLVASGLSKYNVGRVDNGLASEAGQGQRVLLVTGQVEGDAAILLGGQAVRRNADLLRAVRQANPDAFILYKPHPDVVSGNRPPDSVAPDPKHFDQMVTHATISACLAVADEVHTITSLAGFEALLRGKQVVTYGLPFYAGWGLTRDHAACPRRRRRLTLDELVAGVLLLYPRYVNPHTGRFTSPEMMVELLRRSLAAAAPPPRRHTWFGRTWRDARAFAAGIGRELRHVARRRPVEPGRRPTRTTARPSS
jgi:capsular polysaccharide export protein